MSARAAEFNDRVRAEIQAEFKRLEAAGVCTSCRGTGRANESNTARRAMITVRAAMDAERAKAGVPDTYEDVEAYWEQRKGDQP